MIDLVLIRDPLYDEISKDIDYIDEQSLHMVVTIIVIVAIVFQIVFTLVFLYFIIRENLTGIIVMAILCLIALLFSFGYIDDHNLGVTITGIMFSTLIITLSFIFAYVIDAKNSMFYNQIYVI